MKENAGWYCSDNVKRARQLHTLIERELERIYGMRDSRLGNVQSSTPGVSCQTAPHTYDAARKFNIQR